MRPIDHDASAIRTLQRQLADTQVERDALRDHVTVLQAELAAAFNALQQHPDTTRLLARIGDLEAQLAYAHRLEAMTRG